MTTEPLEVIIAIFLITIALFAIYNYSRTNTAAVSSRVVEKKLIARNIAYMLAGLWKYKYITNNSYNYNNFKNDVKKILDDYVGKENIKVEAYMILVNGNTTGRKTTEFLIYNNTGSVKNRHESSASAVIPAMTARDLLPINNYTLNYVNYVHYKRNGPHISPIPPFSLYCDYTFDGRLYVVSYYSTGLPVPWGHVDGTCSVEINGKSYSWPVNGILRLGVANISFSKTIEVSVPFSYLFKPCPEPGDLDVTLYYYPLNFSSSPYTFPPITLSVDEENDLPDNPLNLSHLYPTYLLGEEVKTKEKYGTYEKYKQVNITNRKGDPPLVLDEATLNKFGYSTTEVPFDPRIAANTTGNPGFFVQGPFNLTVEKYSGEKFHIPLFVLPYMVLFKVKVWG